MNKKKLNIVLVVTLISIWSYVSVSLIDTDASEVETGISKGDKELNTQQVGTPDALKFDYKDPFLETKRTIENTSLKRPVRKAKPHKKEEMRWPEIKFYGLVRNKDNNRDFALIDIQTKSLVVRQNEIIGELEVLTYCADSIMVSYKDETRTYVKTLQN
ncbi:MAG: hypothetical protein WEC59_04880 [Salibacteraceae bacterium]